MSVSVAWTPHSHTRPYEFAVHACWLSFVVGNSHRNAFSRVVSIATHTHARASEIGASARPRAAASTANITAEPLSTRVRMALALLLAAGAPALPLDKSITMYHVNPRRFGPIPRNMDTADPAGDFFFEMFEVLSIPLACSDTTLPPWKRPFECYNLESNDNSDVVNKVTLRVNSNFSDYAMCNIGNKENKDPLGRPCPKDTYCCFCADRHHHHHQWPPRAAPCNATVGYSNLHSHFGDGGGWGGKCTKDYECWTEHAAAKLSAANPGAWYSPLAYGDCSLHPSSSSNCTWRVESVDKIVNRTCHSDSFFGAVQKASPEPFENCTRSVRPNATDPCWVRGFYTAVLGPDAAKATGWKVAGLPLEEIIRMWEAPFASSDPAKGGCPALPVPPEVQQLSSSLPMLVEEGAPGQ